MGWILLRRVFINLATLLLIIALSYYLMKHAPGNPFEGEKSLSPQALQALQEKYDFSLPEYLSGIIFHGDFRYSYRHRDLKVAEILIQALPYSIELGLLALLTSVLMGIAWGILAAMLRGTRYDPFIMALALAGIALPSFVIGPVLQLVFSLKMGITPVAGWSSFGSKILPVLTLSLMYIAYISRICRASMQESFSKDFVRTAKAKGLSPFQIMVGHVLRNSLLPLINFLGPATAALMAGTLVVEKIFNIPGMGRYFVESALQRDYPVALGVLIVYSALLLFFNLATDILKKIIDPRIEFA